jgi:uroporphyrinogen III methyltransferase/synthase
MVYLRGQEGDVDETPDVDWAALAALEGTIVCQAGPRLVTRILQALVQHGRSTDDAAAVVYRGTRPDQRTVAGTLGELIARASSGDAEMAATGQLIIGDVTRLRDHVRWFDTRPLFGRRIVITRSPERARELADALENLGAETIQAPTFRLTPAEDPESVDRLAAHADDFDWIVFESAGAAARFLAALDSGPRDLRALGQTAICAVGPSTADELAARGLKADIVIPEVRVESIADALPARLPVDGRRVLIVRPDHQRNTLADALSERGAAVTDLVAYATTADPPDSPAAQRIYRDLLDGRIDAVTFTSPTAVRRFASLIGEEQAADLLGTTAVACIGPVTAAAAQALGIRPTFVASPYTVEGLVSGLVERLGLTIPPALPH